MDATFFPGLVILCAVMLLTQAIWIVRLHSRIRWLIGSRAFAKGIEKGRSETRDSLRYEQEIFDCQSHRFFRRQKSLYIRERVMLGSACIAESERTVVVSSKLTLDNVWNVVAASAQIAFLATGKGSVVRIIQPAVSELWSKHQSEVAAA